MSVQRFAKANSDNQPYHIYYDMNVINNDSSFPAKPVRFQYKETRSNYFLGSPQDYFMSIVRFNLQTPTLPVFIPQIDLNPNSNFGGVYPIQSMSGASNTTAFTVNFYTNIPQKVGSVMKLSLSNGATTSTFDTSNTYDNYYRIVSSTTSSFGVTSTTLLNTGAVPGGVPNNYPGGTTTAFSLLGGSQQLGYAVIPASAMVFNSGTNQLTLTVATTTNLPSLVPLFFAGDIIYINNSSQYNGSYTVLSVVGLVLVLDAPALSKITSLQAYAGGGSFTSDGDFYNITPYTLTLSFTNTTTTTYTSAVTYIPNDLTASPPSWTPSNPQALTLEQLTSPYYYVYNYEVFINMINQTLTNAFWGVNGARYASIGGVKPWLSASGTTVSTYQPPSMSWNSEQLTAILTGDNAIFSQTTLTTTPSFIYFNQALSTLFNSFPYQFQNVRPESPLWSYVVFNTNAGAGLYVVSNYSQLGVITPAYTAIQVYQDHQTASLMNPVQSIVFTSTLLPVVMENVGTPSILNGTAPTSIILGSTANIFPVVTDFIVPFSATNGYVPDISYVPNGEYRLVDLYGESPCNQVDIQVFWKDQYGLLHPFLLGSGCSGSLKLMFRRKDYNNADL
jgi:hypothetical protein